jgi:uncharacterized alkaline shock family protein YloU
MITSDRKKIQIKIKNLEFDIKINSNYLVRNPEIKAKIQKQIEDLIPYLTN